MPFNCLNWNAALQNVVQFLHQDRSYPLSVAVERNNLKVKVKAQRRQELAEEASRLRERLPMQMQHVMDCSSEKGASNWLAVLPLDKLGFSLHKGAFRDTLCILCLR